MENVENECQHFDFNIPICNAFGYFENEYQNFDFNLPKAFLSEAKEENNFYKAPYDKEFEERNFDSMWSKSEDEYGKNDLWSQQQKHYPHAWKYFDGQEKWNPYLHSYTDKLKELQELANFLLPIQSPEKKVTLFIHKHEITFFFLQCSCAESRPKEIDIWKEDINVFGHTEDLENEYTKQPINASSLMYCQPKDSCPPPPVCNRCGAATIWLASSVKPKKAWLHEFVCNSCTDRTSLSICSTLTPHHPT